MHCSFKPLLALFVSAQILRIASATTSFLTIPEPLKDLPNWGRREGAANYMRARSRTTLNVDDRFISMAMGSNGDAELRAVVKDLAHPLTRPTGVQHQLQQTHPGINSISNNTEFHSNQTTPGPWLAVHSICAGRYCAMFGQVYLPDISTTPWQAIGCSCYFSNDSEPFFQKLVSANHTDMIAAAFVFPYMRNLTNPSCIISNGQIMNVTELDYASTWMSKCAEGSGRDCPLLGTNGLPLKSSWGAGDWIATVFGMAGISLVFITCVAIVLRCTCEHAIKKQSSGRI